MAAQEGGAARVELCSDLAAGGTTPAAGMIEVVRKHVGLAVHVMIRPRSGDFTYSDLEFEVMKDGSQRQRNVARTEWCSGSSVRTIRWIRNGRGS